MENNCKNSLLICVCVLIITTHAQFRERERPSGAFLGSFINRIRSREPSRAAMERVLLSVQRYQSLGLTLGELRRRNRFVDFVMRAIEERNKNDPFNPGMYSDYTIEALFQGLCRKTLILWGLHQDLSTRHAHRDITFEGCQILVLTEKECINYFVIYLTF